MNLWLLAQRRNEDEPAFVVRCTCDHCHCREDEGRCGTMNGGTNNVMLLKTCLR